MNYGQGLVYTTTKAFIETYKPGKPDMRSLYHPSDILKQMKIRINRN